MKAYQLIPGTMLGVAGYAALKFGTDDGTAMALLGFALAFAICCHNASAITLRAVISGILVAPAGVAAIAFLRMNLTEYENGFLVMGGVVFLFSSAAYHVGKKCKPEGLNVTQGQ